MDPMQVIVYSRADVPRLRYIAGIILGDILGLQWEIATDRRKLGRRPVINYSDAELSGSFSISPAGLLFESGLDQPDITIGKWKELPVFFMSDVPSDLPFDLFAASFFLVTRYEEYLEHIPDRHGRYKFTSSVAYRNGFLDRPVVDLWVREFAMLLVKKFRNLVFRRNDYQPLLTFDIDQPFESREHGIFSSLGDILRDLTKTTIVHEDGHPATDMGEGGNEIFDYISETVKRYQPDCRFFFPVGDHSTFDLNPSWKNTGYRNLINDIGDRFRTGLHPSYYSFADTSRLKKETGRMRTITGTGVSRARFHSIRIRMPDSYNSLIEAGITEDYSMGYPDHPGFRASIARPFYFFDILQDHQTNLMIIPFQLADIHFFNDTEPDNSGAKELITDIINESRNIGGTFVSIWHNTSLHDSAGWEKWKDLFEFTIKNQADDRIS
jgi:hypothetical protein